MRSRREKVFGPGRAVPLDGNAKARIQAYARAWSGRNRQPGQHKGPITRAFLDVLEALLWGFHNAAPAAASPATRRSPTEAECARSTVAEALKVLELAGVLSWQHRIARIRVRERDLFGRSGRAAGGSSAPVQRLRLPRPESGGFRRFASKSENPPGTLNQEISLSSVQPASDPDSPLEHALQRFGAVIEAKSASNGNGALVGAT